MKPEIIITARGHAGTMATLQSEFTAHLLADAPGLPRAPRRERQAVLDYLTGKGFALTDFPGWDRLDAHERALGDAETAAGATLPRERVKVISRAEMTAIARQRDRGGARRPEG